MIETSSEFEQASEISGSIGKTAVNEKKDTSSSQSNVVACDMGLVNGNDVVYQVVDEKEVNDVVVVPKETSELEKPYEVSPPSPPNCPNNQVWSECGSACIRTCADPNPLCTIQCVQHCECPPHLPIFNNGVCISFRECPAPNLEVPNDVVDTEGRFFDLVNIENTESPLVLVAPTEKLEASTCVGFSMSMKDGVPEAYFSRCPILPDNSCPVDLLSEYNCVSTKINLQAGSSVTKEEVEQPIRRPWPAWRFSSSDL